VNFPRLHLGIGLAIVLAAASATAGFAQTTGGLGPNPEIPQPLPATAAAAPSASASAGPRRGKRAPGPAASGSPAPPQPSDTPEPPQFSTLDGVWEVEMQPLGRRLAVYSHLSIAVTGTTISGYYEHTPGKTRSKMTGTFDGRLISMDIAMPDGTTLTLSGYVEGFADMVGLSHAGDKDPGTAFTAQHRKKLKG
jgi:hypothetical protein